MEKIINDSNVKLVKFWQGKRVLITGITGFIGSNLALSLLDKGAHVTGLVRDKVSKSNFQISGIEPKITIVNGELENLALLERIIVKYEIEYIFHLGAQSIVNLANRSPVSTFEANIQGTWYVLEAARRMGGVQGIVVAGSYTSYGKHETLPYKENFCLLSTSPYDISKACADLISRGYSHTYGLSVAVLRCSNTYGPGDLNSSRIIPDTIKGLLQDRDPIIRSDGTPVRDYLYIEDAINAYLLVAMTIKDPKIQGQVFNVGTNQPVSVLEVVEKLIKISGKSKLSPKIIGKGILHGEIDCRYLDSKKISDALGWSCKTKIDNGLKLTWDWWVSNWNILKEF